MEKNDAGWIVMWALALAIFAASKWLTFRDAVKRGVSIDRARAAGYLLAWPGMDAAAFLSPVDRRGVAALADGVAAVLTIGLGAVLIWGLAPAAIPAHPLAAGWIAMIGIVLVLHFGAFALLSAVWRHAGVNAIPVMRQPLRSTALAEFWGRRWNTAFHALAARFAFGPLRRQVGTTAATLGVFLLSGAIHELVITVPAGGGYGLPTIYFLIQALGVTAERSTRGRRLGLGKGVRGRCFTLLVTAAPAFWLFPPVFVRGVILPMLAAIGAIPRLPCDSL